MSRSFAITSAAESVSLDSHRRADVTFTVTNSLGGPVTARASVVAKGKTQASWLVLRDEEERDFDADGTHQYTVRVTVPADAAPGTYTFTLLVSDTSNPDDNYAEGPAVSFTVEQVEAPPAKPFPWWIVALVGGIVVIVVVAIVIGVTVGKKPKELALHDDCTGGDVPCAAGLSCVGGTCLADQGQACTTSEDCGTANCLEDKTCGAPLPGGACAEDGTCPEGQSCVAALPAPSKTRMKKCLADLDQPCTSADQCGSNNCKDSVCVLAATKSKCTSTSDCPTDQKCVEISGTKYCERIPGLPCDTDFDCTSLWCMDDGKCSRDDGKCENDSQCKGNLPCTNKVCGKPDGAACSDASECVSRTCASGKCGVNKIKGKALGSACLLDSECASGYCETRKCTQKPFTFPYDAAVMQQQFRVVVPQPVLSPAVRLPAHQ